MEMKLGSSISKLRKSKGLTQEQLASAVGVSAPAVSKWESGYSCPDISLLCPLARVLGTNVDTLLQFEEALTEEQLTKEMNSIVETARNGNCHDAEEALQNLLHTYPSSIHLKYTSAVIMDTFLFLFPKSDEEKMNYWRTRKKQLLEDVYKSGVSSYWQSAVSGLISISIQEGELDKAEQLLKELPEHTADTAMLKARLYQKRNEPEKALEVTQKRLFALVNQLEMCLMSMIDEIMIPDTDRLLEICNVSKQLEEMFHIGYLSDGLFVEAYKRIGDSEAVKNSMIRMIDSVTSLLQSPNPLLFSPTMKIQDKNTKVSKELKEMLLRGIMEDSSFSDYDKCEEFHAAVERLRESIKQS